jgi:MFS transporter, DHA1 family, tetracycline resistance protein
MFKNPRLLLIYAIVLLDVVIGSASGPVLPQFVQGLAQPQLWLTLGTALFLGVQLVSAPVLGALSDQLGRRPLVIVSSVGTLLANAFLLPIKAGLFFVNRLSDGLTNGLYALMRSSVADSSKPEEVVENTGLLSTLQSLGSVLGPLVATAVFFFVPQASQQARWVVWAVLGLAALNIGLSWFFQETAKDTKPYDAGELKKQIRQNLNIRHLWVRIKEMDGDKPGLTSLTLLTLLLTLNQGYLNYFIPYIGLGQLKLNPTQISYFFVFFGGLSAVANYIYFKYLLHKLDKKKVLIVAAWVGVALHILYANVHSSVLLLYLAAAADAISVSLIGGLLNGLVAQLSGEDDRGELFGITQALAGAASLVTTLVYGALSLVSLNAPFYWFALCMAVLAVMAMRLVLPPEPEGQGEAAPAPA